MVSFIHSVLLPSTVEVVSAKLAWSAEPQWPHLCKIGFLPIPRFNFIDNKHWQPEPIQTWLVNKWKPEHLGPLPTDYVFILAQIYSGISQFISPIFYCIWLTHSSAVLKILPEHPQTFAAIWKYILLYNFSIYCFFFLPPKRHNKLLFVHVVNKNYDDLYFTTKSRLKVKMSNVKCFAFFADDKCAWWYQSWSVSSDSEWFCLHNESLECVWISDDETKISRLHI